MKLTVNEKMLINNLIGKIINNVSNGENSKELTTDESLIFSFSNVQELIQLGEIQDKLIEALKKRFRSGGLNIMKTLIIIPAIISAIVLFSTMPTDTEVMQQCAIDDELNRIEAAKMYELETYKNR